MIPSTDTDNDGIPDAAEVSLGLLPNNPVDALEDIDGDGLTNLDEYRLSTDLRNTDTDGDGIGDGLEVRLGLNPRVTDPTTTVIGFVQAGGAPVNAATVSLFGGQFSTITDATGAFTMRFIPAGLGTLTALARLAGAGLQAGSSSATAAVAAGTTNLGTIQLATDGGTVTGLVRNAANGPVVGAAVTLTSGPVTRGATTDATGRYTVTQMLAGAVSVAAVDPVTGQQSRGGGTRLFLGYINYIPYAPCP